MTSFEKINDKQWLLVISGGELEEDIEIEINATIEGLEIDDYGTIYWEELEGLIP